MDQDFQRLFDNYAHSDPNENQENWDFTNNFDDYVPIEFTDTQYFSGEYNNTLINENSSNNYFPSESSASICVREYPCPADRSCCATDGTDKPRLPPFNDGEVAQLKNCGHLFEIDFTLDCSRECPIDFGHSNTSGNICTRESKLIRSIRSIFGKKSKNPPDCPKEGRTYGPRCARGDGFNPLPSPCKDCRRDCPSDCGRDCSSDCRPDWCLPRDGNSNHQRCPFDCWFDR